MPITRLNHAVLYVRDARRSAAFYTEALGMAVRHAVGDGQAIFLCSPGSDNDHDLGLFSVGDEVGASPAGRETVGKGVERQRRRPSGTAGTCRFELSPPR